MEWLPDRGNYFDTFIRFDMIHERVGRTDRRTLHDSIGRGKKSWHTVLEISGQKGFLLRTQGRLLHINDGANAPWKK